MSDLACLHGYTAVCHECPPEVEILPISEGPGVSFFGSAYGGGKSFGLLEKKVAEAETRFLASLAIPKALLQPQESSNRATVETDLRYMLRKVFGHE